MRKVSRSGLRRIRMLSLLVQLPCLHSTGNLAYFTWRDIQDARESERLGDGSPSSANPKAGTCQRRATCFLAREFWCSQLGKDVERISNSNISNRIRITRHCQHDERSFIFRTYPFSGLESWKRLGRRVFKRLQRLIFKDLWWWASRRSKITFLVLMTTEVQNDTEDDIGSDCGHKNHGKNRNQNGCRNDSSHGESKFSQIHTKGSLVHHRGVGFRGKIRVAIENCFQRTTSLTSVSFC